MRREALCCRPVFPHTYIQEPTVVELTLIWLAFFGQFALDWPRFAAELAYTLAISLIRFLVSCAAGSGKTLFTPRSPEVITTDPFQQDVCH
jgi:hypothetical protein